MLALYIAIILFSLGVIAMIIKRNFSATFLFATIIGAAIIAYLFTGCVSLLASSFDSSKEVETVYIYQLSEIDGYCVFEDEYDNYNVLYNDVNMTNLNCYKNNTVFVYNDKMNTVSIYENRYKSPFLRHMLFNMIADDYVISCNFNAVKPYINTCK